MMKTFHIHGDNIVECERTLDLIKQGFSDGDDKVKVDGPLGTFACPEFRMKSPDVDFKFVFYPGFNRWHEDILSLVKYSGGMLREITDVIITEVEGKTEKPVLAIEFCGALPAGNQAWQRSGRAYSYGRAKIPFLYVADLGGFELDKHRNRKAPRLPNPAVPFSYLSNSIENSTLTLPIYLKNYGTSKEVSEAYDGAFGEHELISIIRNTLINTPIDNEVEILKQKALIATQKIAEKKKNKDSLSSDEWEKLHDYLINKHKVVDYISTSRKLDWKKKISIPTVPKTLPTLLRVASKYALGITAKNLPFCLIPKENRKKLASEIINIYQELDEDFKSWLSKDEDLVICCITGFKPKGDDSRPDRGLPPLLRMLVGESVDMLTVVYGPAYKNTWKTLKEEPGVLIENNGLWQSILGLSDAVLVDSRTASFTSKGFLSEHWKEELPQIEKESIYVTPKPKNYSEHDVDTFLHLLFYHLGSDNVFEGMCNPPGGDWSGISILSKETNKELRWLSLPRISGENSKRPDHLFQISNEEKDTLLIIESKETIASVKKEGDIGVRLKNYVENLVQQNASVEKSIGTNDWSHSQESIDIENYNFTSAAACKVKNLDSLIDISSNTKCDILFGLDFKGDKLDLFINSTSIHGKHIEEFIIQITDQDPRINVISRETTQ